MPDFTTGTTMGRLSRRRTQRDGPCTSAARPPVPAARPLRPGNVRNERAGNLPSDAVDFSQRSFPCAFGRKPSKRQASSPSIRSKGLAHETVLRSRRLLDGAPRRSARSRLQVRSREGRHSHKKTAGGEDYWKINPKGYVPALKLDDGQVLTEVQVICQYLADHKADAALAPKAGTMERYRLMEMLNFTASEIHKQIGALFNPKMTPE